MNKFIQIIQTICQISIVILLVIIALELRYSYFATPAAYDGVEKTMNPPSRIIIDNLLQKTTNFTNTQWNDLKLPN